MGVEVTKIFERNLELWAKEHPVEAFWVRQADTRTYRQVKNPDGSLNVKAPFGLLYSGSPKSEAAEWIKSLPKENFKLLYVYGVGLGNYFLSLKEWLEEDPERHVVFFEDDLAVLKRFFEQDIAASILTHDRVNVCFLSDPKDDRGVLETLYWSFILTPFHITALKSYGANKGRQFEEFAHKIAYSTTMKNALVDEYLRYGVAFFKSFYPNILELHRSYWGNALFGKFKGVPAIICGAGPSLEKQIPLLKTLKSRALIFAGGSALNALSSNGLLPHFGAGIDPNPAQFLRLSASQAHGVPFFYRNRMFTDAFRKIRGPRLYVSGAGGYDVAEYYEEKFGLTSDYLDEGHNVVNFCTEVASRLGCHPIIYIGMDLAFTGMKSYTGGVEEKVDIDEEALLNAQDEEKKGLKRKDIYGKPILTLWKWIAESEWLGEFAKNHPDISFLNATEGGIGLAGIPNIPFKQAAEKELCRTFDLIGRVHGEIQMSSIPQVTEEKVVQATTDLKESLKRCMEWIDMIGEDVQKQQKSENILLDNPSGRSALAETELYDEPGYQFILDMFHQVYSRVLNKKITEIRVNKQDKFDERTIAKKKLELQLEKLQFLRNAAEANIVLIDYALKERIEYAEKKPRE